MMAFLNNLLRCEITGWTQKWQKVAPAIFVDISAVRANFCIKFYSS